MNREDMARALVEHRVSMLRLALVIVRGGADAEDAVSEASVRALKKCASLRDPAKVKKWLMSITARAAYDILRRRRRETPVAELPEIPVLDYPAESLFARIRRELPAGYADVLVLYYYEGYAAKEIAEMLKLPLGTVTMRLSRGRDRLKRLLTEGGEIG